MRALQLREPCVAVGVAEHPVVVADRNRERRGGAGRDASREIARTGAVARPDGVVADADRIAELAERLARDVVRVRWRRGLRQHRQCRRGAGCLCRPRGDAIAGDLSRRNARYQYPRDGRLWRGSDRRRRPKQRRHVRGRPVSSLPAGRSAARARSAAKRRR